MSHRRLLLHRQGSDLRTLLLRSVQPELTPAECVVQDQACQLLNEFGKSTTPTALRAAIPALRWAVGFARVNSVEDPQRPQNADRRLAGGQDAFKLGTRPAVIAGGDIYPALEKARSTHRGRSPLGNDRSSASTGRQVLLISRLVGRWHGAAFLHQTDAGTPWKAYNRSPRCGLRLHANMAQGCLTHPSTLKRLVANGTLLRPFSRA